MIIAFDSLKFYKLKNENTAKLLFVILYVLIFISYVFPFGKPLTLDFLMKSLQDNPTAVIEAFGVSQVIYYFSMLVLSLLTSFIALIYANCMVMESENFPNRKAVRTSFLRLPQIIFYLILTIPVIFLSSMLLFLPLLFLYYAMFFVPLFVTEGRKNVFEAIIESFNHTKGYKFSILFTNLTIYFIMNIPISIVNASFLSTGYNNTTAEFLILSFLRAAYILMTGRMMGSFYLLLVKNKDKIEKIKNGLMSSKINYDTLDRKDAEDEDDEYESEEEYDDGQEEYDDDKEEFEEGQEEYHK